MNNTQWVLGHKISTIPVSGDYDLVIGLTPANIPGPPPHYHSNYTEVFLVLEGEMVFTINGESKIIRAGESVDLPPNTLHTFNNKSDLICKWVNVHSPKGFSSFFSEFGILEEEQDAMKKSLAQSIINKVMESGADYDMHIRL